MAVVFTETMKSAAGKTVRVFGNLVFSGNYIVGGEVPTGHVKPFTTKAPLSGVVNNKGANTFKYDPVTGKVLVFAAGVELTAAAYPASVTTDPSTMVIEYPKFG